MVHGYKNKINRRFNRLVLDFEEYIQDKNNKKTSTNKSLTNNFFFDPLPPKVDAPVQLRDILERNAKSDIPNGYYTGLAIQWYKLLFIFYSYIINILI